MRRVCEALEKTHGLSRFGNPMDPVDDLVYIIISNKTSPGRAQETYMHLKRFFGTWENLLNSTSLELRLVLQPAGLATVKSRQIRAALTMIKRDFGACDLATLRDWRQDAIKGYLIALPGVSEKVAKCVMMYTMGAQVLPVDSHVHRMARRLGWTERNRADESHAELEALVPPNRRFAFHVGCIAHGRAICRPKLPACEDCCIGKYCTQPPMERS